jgi:5-(carboxyamino)imidazole ribonucleotide synthase
MFAMAARRMGYLVHTFSPETDTPTGQVADTEVAGAYEDLDAVREFARRVEVVTFEFENIPAASVEAIAEFVPVRPNGALLHTTQNRIREKTYLAEAGFPVTPFHPVRSLADVHEGVARLGLPAIIKTAGFGYDGKGQRRVTTVDEAADAYLSQGGAELILEKQIDFALEISVVAARGADGEVAHYGVIENQHERHILDCSVTPASVAPEIARRAVEITESLLDELDVIGVLCVEFFLTGDGTLYINELAPRPHNSGHLTIDACTTSQFEQQLRAVAGLPLGATTLRSPAAMVNLLGDIWLTTEPDWRSACAFPNVKLHLYGKHEPRAGRKMGHLTACAATPDEARRLTRAARNALLKTMDAER